ncbi:MAG TPA: hypothetical protein VGB99_05775 [Acidobacteriota bacterium]
MSLPFTYSVYGLRFEVDRPLPALAPLRSSAPADTQVRLKSFPPWGDELAEATPAPWYVSADRGGHGPPFLTAWKLGGGQYLRLVYGAGADILMDRRGTQVWTRWSEAAPPEDAELCLLGPILALVLRLRGFQCLHASAVAIGDRALALLGPPGSGKSTTAAALTQLGFRVMTDDVVVLEERGESMIVQPGHPRLGLWPEAVEALYGSADCLPRISPRLEKRCLDLSSNAASFQSESLPLGGLYILAPRSEDPAAPYVEALGGHAGLLQLVRNSYMRFLLDPAMRACELRLLNRTMAKVAVRQVTPGSDPNQLGRLCAVILEDFERVGSPVLAAEPIFF